MALAIIHSGTITGKLNGVMPATTPSGSRTVCTSTPVETSVECDPLSRCGIPQANSMFSRPRATSPAASLSTLPCSAVTAAARSGAAAATRSRRRKRTAARALSDPAAPLGGGLGRPPRPRRRPRRPRPEERWPSAPRGQGRRRARCAPTVPATDFPPTQCSSSRMARSCHRGRRAATEAPSADPARTGLDTAAGSFASLASSSEIDAVVLGEVAPRRPRAPAPAHEEHEDGEHQHAGQADGPPPLPLAGRGLLGRHELLLGHEQAGEVSASTRHLRLDLRLASPACRSECRSPVGCRRAGPGRGGWTSRRPPSAPWPGCACCCRS